MKKLLLLLIPLFFLQKALSQPVVFCPVGAKWHYSFYQGIYPQSINEIRYIKDSLLGSELVKVLKHYGSKFYLSNNWINGGNGLTFIKQKGDTVFFKNYLTQGSWQILYNYAAQPGQGWQTTIITNGMYGNVPSTYSITVNSVNTIAENSINLRQLAITYTANMAMSPFTGLYFGSTKVTERFGGNTFMFNYVNQKSATDGDEINKFLCYEDSSFGLKQFTSSNCYGTNTGLHENALLAESMVLFPNPAGNHVKISFPNLPGAELQLHLTDISGRKLKQIDLETSHQQHTIDLNGLSNSVYLVSVMKNEKLIYTTKLVKQE